MLFINAQMVFHFVNSLGLLLMLFFPFLDH